MYTYSLLTLIILFVIQTNSERRKCQIIPVQIQEGLKGYCCVFLKNASEIKAYKEQTFGNNFRNNCKEHEIKRDHPQQTGTMIFPQEKTSERNNSQSIYKTNKEPTSSSLESHHKIVFPEEKTTAENRKNVNENSTNIKKPCNSTKKNSMSNNSCIEFPQNNVKVNVTTDKNNTNVINRNNVDIPETCTDGKQIDHNGDCVDAF